MPWFSTLFGRDSLITSLQTVPFRPQLGVETLAVLAARQATEVDEWRDAEPGKILHELRDRRDGARPGSCRTRPYYGTVDATPLWLILLGEVYDWTGDRELVDRLWPNALAALDWIDRYGDRDGDGFVEYERRTDRGLLNQGWKDSGDAIRDRQGREARRRSRWPRCRATSSTPSAGWPVWPVSAATRRWRSASSRTPSSCANASRPRSGSRTRATTPWPSTATSGRRTRSGRMPGTACGAGSSRRPGRDKVATRLMSPSMFSGWGVRTYAVDQPGYNPIGYHTGTVWPHDSSLIAAGLKRYGFDEESNRLVGDILEAAQRFPAFRLPELFCGFEREENPDPVPYPVACSPQAWSAGAPFLFLKTMLGLQAHADRNELELRHPHLPAWVDKVTLRNLQVGEGSVDLLFHSWRGTTSAEVLRKVGDVNVTIRL